VRRGQLLAALTAGTLIGAACAAMSGSLRVKVEPSTYSPVMSSTVGIGLLPDFDRPEGEDIRIHWRADFGRFVSWKGPSYEVVPHGPDFTTGREKVYWTYDAATAPTHRRPVQIEVEAIDWKTGVVLVRTGLVLVWDGDVVRLR